MINPSEPEVYFKGDEHYQPGVLRELTIDYLNRKIRGTVKDRQYGTPHSKLFVFDSPLLIELVDPDKESYG